MDIFLVSNNHAKWDEFNKEMAQEAVQISTMSSLENAQKSLKNKPPTLIILDLGLEGKAVRDAVISLLMINATVHTAIVSSMNAEKFHEFTEGLGILTSLPENPKASDAKNILHALNDLAD